MRHLNQYPLPVLATATAFLLVTWLSVRPVLAADKAATQPTTAPVLADGSDVEIDYEPPVDGAPAQRIGGATRPHPLQVGLYAIVLAPAGELGRTGSRQPVLFWYLSQPTDYPIDIGLTSKGRSGKEINDPIVDLHLVGHKEAGIHRLELSKCNDADNNPVRLEPGVQYDWAVVVAGERQSGSKNPYGACRFVYVIPPATVAEASKTGDPAKLASACAKSGLWYDALANVNAAIDQHPESRNLREQRRAFLAKQNLVEDANGRITEPKAQPGNATR
jgi:hypothetical protein